MTGATEILVDRCSTAADSSSRQQPTESSSNAMEIWINPACSKCRSAKAALDAAGIGYTERRYLEEPPTSAELRDVLSRMGLEPWDIARPAETRAAGIDLPRDAGSRDAWITAMVANPIVIQRPIITAGDGTTAIARDPESVERMLERERDS